jgi:tRNA pseudouridine32 synthase/23S rRNA pseudouridine746 synthase/23S rRNA pseudouridine1911/1915/1917 synthase
MQHKDRAPRRHRLRGLEVVFEDRDLIVVEKPAGLLTMSPHRDQPNTVERILTGYLRKGNPRSRLRAYVVHRLDRDTSGLLVFAKSDRVQQQLKDHWRDTDKRYFAVVHGHLEKSNGTISGYLAEDRDQFVHVTKSAIEGKWAETEYAVLKETQRYSALAVTLHTGRKNQIRVHFAHIGHPVVGDPKYGHKERHGGRMALHATHLEFDHPYSGRRMVFDSRVPEELLRLVGGSVHEPDPGGGNP